MAGNSGGPKTPAPLGQVRKGGVQICLRPGRETGAQVERIASDGKQPTVGRLPADSLSKDPQQRTRRHRMGCDARQGLGPNGVEVKWLGPVERRIDKDHAFAALEVKHMLDLELKVSKQLRLEPVPLRQSLYEGRSQGIVSAGRIPAGKHQDPAP